MRNHNQKPYSISEINLLVKDLFDNTKLFKNITLKGEISNFKAYPKAFYFSLKDQESQISAVMFFNYRNPVAFTPMDGDEVLVLGTLKVYEKRGTYQIVVEDMNQYGVGLQLIKLQELKSKLEKEGLFSETRKRPLSRYPKSIGVIAGNDSAAYKDIITNLRRRYPIAMIYFFPTLVQGVKALEDIIKALDKAYTYPLDTLIIGRGGGSEEDLSAFNDEAVVRKIAISPIPTIGAIGHEINTTLADLVCDKRASTPTGAAELATRDKPDIIYEIQMLNNRLYEAMESRLSLLKEQIERYKDKAYFTNPLTIYHKQTSNIDILKEKLKNLLLQQLSFKKDKLNNYQLSLVSPSTKIDQMKTYVSGAQDKLHRFVRNKHESMFISLVATTRQLNALSPYQVLERGYSLVSNDKGDIITDSNQVNVGETITTTLKHGKISSVVKERK